MIERLKNLFEWNFTGVVFWDDIYFYGGDLKAELNGASEKPLWIWNFTGVVFWDDIYFDRGEDDEIYDDGNESDDYVYFPLKKI